MSLDIYHNHNLTRHWRAEKFLDMERELPVSLEQLKAIEVLISRSWFRRLWVRQGVLLSGNGTIALVGIPLLHFSGAIELIGVKGATLKAKLPLHLSIDFFNMRSFSLMRRGRESESCVAHQTWDCTPRVDEVKDAGVVSLSPSEVKI
ncbi:hypothetical protein B0I35DRAFT_443871 [Stachybotrys elegans]|uniref:Uncharacterized protein n=1 Tax=Stachybotrys elegans TaxID=80388 RepID=A0A8K0SEN1_9HYPO|nr:hypothetical protein B0I35DRAFT_443871 [Stachybotrys elegans]